MKPETQLKANNIKKMLNKGKTIKQIAKKTGYSREYVYKLSMYAEEEI